MKSYNISIIICILLCFSSCKEEEIIELSGDITGVVNLLNNNGNEVTDQSGTTISIDNTSFSATTNENGVFTIENVPAGTYNFTISNDESSSITDFSQFTGGNIPYFMGQYNLYLQPTNEIESYELEYSSDGEYVTFSGIVTETGNLAVRVFIGDDENVSPSNYDDGIFTTYIRNGFSDREFGFRIFFSNYSTDESGKLYMAVYFMNYAESKTYGYPYGYTSYKQVSDVMSFTVE